MIGATVGILLGGVIIAAAILAITSGGGVPNVRKPLAFGLRRTSTTRFVRAAP